MQTHNRIFAQQGAALIIFFLAILLTGTIFVVSSLSIEKGRTEYEKVTSSALATAKEALIAYAATYHDLATNSGIPRSGLMGFLPCPDNNADPAFEGRAMGSCGSQYSNDIGRLPWKSLEIEPLKDGSGNCLWYAVSGEYKNSGNALDPRLLPATSALGRSDMLNDDSFGSFRLRDNIGAIIKGNSAEDRAVAVIIAPGPPVAGQSRTHDNATDCGGDLTANRFLEVFNGVDNTTVSLAADQVDDFITAERTNDSVFNDRIITITQAEIFDEIKRRGNFTTIVENTTQALAECVAEFGLTNPGGGGGTPCPELCSDCYAQCDIDFDCTGLRGGARAQCNSDNRNCDRQCRRDGCVRRLPPGCGTGGANDFRLPWPALVDLGDYRDSAEYIEDSSSHMGRFPMDVNATLAATGNPGSTYLLESDYSVVDPSYTSCRDLNTNALGTYNSVERRFWQNWKDHFFYAVAADYDASNTSTPTVLPCTNCLSTNGTGSYAGIVFFASERHGGQVRTTDNMNPPDAETKNMLGNYLEANNANIVHDGTGDYQSDPSGTINVNDVAYCINEVLDTTTADPNDTTFEVINCTGP